MICAWVARRRRFRKPANSSNSRLPERHKVRRPLPATPRFAMVLQICNEGRTRDAAHVRTTLRNAISRQATDCGFTPATTARTIRERRASLPIVCLPGLSRNSRDFHLLAMQLSTDPEKPRRVVALDYRGRGLFGLGPGQEPLSAAGRGRRRADGMRGARYSRRQSSSARHAAA